MSKNLRRITKWIWHGLLIHELGNCYLIILVRRQLLTLNLNERSPKYTCYRAGYGVMIPALMFGNVFATTSNLAFTLGLAVSGLFSWEQVPYYILAQVLGAILSSLPKDLHRPYYLKTRKSKQYLWVPSQRFQASTTYKRITFCSYCWWILTSQVHLFFLCSTYLTKTLVQSVSSIHETNGYSSWTNCWFKWMAVKAQVAPHSCWDQLRHLALALSDGPCTT